MTTGQNAQDWKQMLNQMPFSRGVARVYAALLGLATSQSDIERLHDLLPPNQQVFGEELKSLRRVRKTMYNGNPPSNGTRPDDNVCREILRTVGLGWTQQVYYVDYLTNDRDEYEFAARHWAFALLFNTRGGGGEAVHNLSLTLDTERFEVQLVHPDDDLLRVRLIKWGSELTLSNTRMMLCHPVLSTLPHGKLLAEGKKGVDLDYWIVLEATPFKEYLSHELSILGSFGDGAVWMMKEGFIEKLESALRELGLEIGPIVPDFTTADNGE